MGGAPCLILAINNSPMDTRNNNNKKRATQLINEWNANTNLLFTFNNYAPNLPYLSVVLINSVLMITKSWRENVKHFATLTTSYLFVYMCACVCAHVCVEKYGRVTSERLLSTKHHFRIKSCWQSEKEKRLKMFIKEKLLRVLFNEMVMDINSW